MKYAMTPIDGGEVRFGYALLLTIGFCADFWLAVLYAVERLAF